MKSDDTEKATKALSYLFALPLIGLTYWWYNHIFFKPILAYWIWLLMSIPILLLPKFIRKCLYILLPVALALQILSWAHIVTFPIIH